MIPEKAGIMNMTSQTLESISLNSLVMYSGRYNPVRKIIGELDKTNQGEKRRKYISSPSWAIGSVHAVTQDGKLMIASYSGSQLPAYAYGSGRVIFIVGTQKIVKDVQEGINRIYRYCLKLENRRVKRAYGSGSAVNKILIINKEINIGRITLIFVNQVLGF